MVSEIASVTDLLDKIVIKIISINILPLSHFRLVNVMNVSYILFSSLLEILCSTLYDSLRPVIIHMNHMETLTELCTILKVHLIV